MKLWSVWVLNEGWCSFPREQMAYKYVWEKAKKEAVHDETTQCLLFLAEHHPEYEEIAMRAYAKAQGFDVVEGVLHGHVMGDK